MLLFSETWFNENVPDTAVQPPGFSVYRSDRVSDVTRKTRGGGVCILVNDRWATDVKVLSKTCSANLEALIISCRPFYLPREFSCVISVAVYIPPDGNAGAAIAQLYEEITKAENTNPDAFVVIAGDFNHANLSKDMPKYYQQVTCPTRDGKTLDHCYTSIKGAYRSIPRAPLGRSDHSVVFLLPVYTQKLKRVKPVIKTVKVWSQDATEKLRGCFEATDWGTFSESASDLHEYTETVTDYISFCESVCIPTKTVKSYGNDKPWFTKDIKMKLKKKHAAFKSEDKSNYKQARYVAEKAVKEAKLKYKRKIEENFASQNSRELWQQLQQITNYKPAAKAADALVMNLPDSLNDFYSRFDKKNTTPPPCTGKPSQCDPPFTVEEVAVRRLFSHLNGRKATGPDNISPRLLKNCADQLSGVFTHIFNLSLSHCTVPQCFKKSTIIPVPKKPTISSLNDYRPVALTSVVMKTLEKLVLQFLKSVTDPNLDPFQFAYRERRCVEDAVALGVYYALRHLDRPPPNSYVRILFVDYSSAFNTVIPAKLYTKLHELGVPESMCLWILDFLLQRPQVVRIGERTSSCLTLSTGTPQGCVLSPILYSLFTYDCVATHENIKVLKFADDTTVEGLITNGDESLYRHQINTLVDWCQANNLELNGNKTKEMVVDFRRHKTPLSPVVVNGEAIETVPHFKLLGSILSSDLGWEENTTTIVRKAQQRLYFLRRLKGFGLGPQILLQFYRAVIESVLTFSITVWYGSTTVKEKTRLDRVVKTASRIIGLDLPTLDSLYQQRLLSRATTIAGDQTHPGHNVFKLLPSGRRYQYLNTKTKRFHDSFFPQAAQALSNQLV